MDDLKYRSRLSASVDRGLYEAIFNYSIDTQIPLSRLLDEAIEGLLNKRNISYQKAGSPRRKKSGRF